MSNLASITQLISNRLEFLGTVADTVIEQYRLEAFYYIQNQTEKSDMEVEDETVYTPLQRMLLADIASYFILKRRVVSSTAGTGASAGTGAKRVKKAKADVVETEFEYSDKLQMEAEAMLQQARRDACEKAKILSYSLPLCEDDLGSGDEAPIPPFFHFTDC